MNAMTLQNSFTSFLYDHHCPQKVNSLQLIRLMRSSFERSKGFGHKYNQNRGLFCGSLGIYFEKKDRKLNQLRFSAYMIFKQKSLQGLSYQYLSEIPMETILAVNLCRGT